VDKLVALFRKQGKKVGVIAIDPSSPFSGGAVLGDRIRMQDHNADEGVFIRSLGSRGAHGGLSRATADIAELMTVFGFEMIVIETVGVGQTELDIMTIADTTLVVLVPESGDTIQTMKAGLMEIATIFVVNKSDREGADRIFAELSALSEMHTGTWSVPVIKTVATQNQGLAETMTAIESHAAFLKKNPIVKQSAETIFWDVLTEALKEKICHEKSSQVVLKKLRTGDLNPYEAVRKILTDLS
jgi:LAO/AO transport system kinase